VQTSLIMQLLHPLARPLPDAQMSIPPVGEVGPIRIGVGGILRLVAPASTFLDIPEVLGDVFGIVLTVGLVPGSAVAHGVE